jgi:hypothetical protein
MVMTVNETKGVAKSQYDTPVYEMYASTDANNRTINVPGFSVQFSTIPEGTNIPTSPLILRRSLIVQIEASRDGYVVSSDNLNEEGYGITLDEAYFDFMTSLRDRLQSLNRTTNHLAEVEIDVLTKLRSFFGV